MKAPALFNATVTQAERRVVYRKLRFDKRLGALPEPRVAAIRHRRMLAQSSTKRALAAPKVPMVAEQTGIRDFDIAAWVGILVPRGAPPEIVTKLNQAVSENSCAVCWGSFATLADRRHW